MTYATCVAKNRSQHEVFLQKHVKSVGSPRQTMQSILQVIELIEETPSPINDRSLSGRCLGTINRCAAIAW